jgi:ATP-dependent helicase/nuclease subunit A
VTERPDPSLPEVAEATHAQRRAASPQVSAFVSANAGSGKTRVLTERVARLLLAGEDPARILCITYTRAAAAEMANRLSALLGRWALMPEADLRAALTELGEEEGRAPLDAAALARARRLFAKALETPGGLKIQTIHAFCAAALRRFPLEAGVAPDFAEIDEVERDRLAARAIERLAEAAEAGEDTGFDGIAAHLGEEGLAGMAREVLARRSLFRPAATRAETLAAFGVTEIDLGRDALAAWWAGLDRDMAARAAEALCAGSTNDTRLGEPLAEALAGGGLDAVAGLFLTGDGAPRKLGSAPTKATGARHPWLGDWLRDQQAAYLDAAERDHAAAAAERALALNRFAPAFLAAFEDEKRARGALDFDDLVERALALVDNPESGPWALYKLDGGIDHLLVDEAQDTSPAQWRLIEALVAEFHAGAGRRLGRTLFVVGDAKQSIYSFQGAEPRLFGTKRDSFASRLHASGQSLLRVPLITSFRSAPVVLRAVDSVFALAPGGVSADDSTPQHVSAWPTRPGRVDLWPAIEKETAAPAPPWDVPVDAPPPGDPRLRLARLLAAEIARWVREREPLPGAGRAVEPGDVLVLVRRRDRLASELVRSLKALDIPVAGSDRIEIAAELAVRDLLACLRFALNAADDLSLAAVLRSPLCGVSEEGLFALAHGREGPLWPRVRAAGGPVADFLGRLLDRADFLRPFEFLDMILTGAQGRHRLLARLGPEAEDAIDELLAQALAYETDHTPSLDGFLDWLGRAAVSIKREQDKGEGTVRVMTVHGAKGLESPIVVLPDTLSTRLGRASALTAIARPGRRNAEAAPLAAWRAPKGAMPAVLADAADAEAQAAREESRRLLYVAMTRAERWLVVAGAGKRSENGETWHGLMEAGMRAAGATPVDGPVGLPGPVLRLAEGEPGSVAPATSRCTAPLALPAWAGQPPGPPPPTAPRRAASDLAPGGGGPGDGLDAALARRRGTAIHALLEHLPRHPAADRAALAARLLAALAPQDAAHHADWAAEAMAALALPAAADWFGPDCMAEVALSWQGPGGGRIAGRIDRLRVGPSAVAVLDIKTDAAPPPRAEAVPEAYLRQMAAYRAALSAMWPGRAVSVALLWTALPAVMPLPEALLDAALARIAEA